MRGCFMGVIYHFSTRKRFLQIIKGSTKSVRISEIYIIASFIPTRLLLVAWRRYRSKRG